MYALQCVFLFKISIVNSWIKITFIIYFLLIYITYLNYVYISTVLNFVLNFINWEIIRIAFSIG